MSSLKEKVFFYHNKRVDAEIMALRNAQDQFIQFNVLEALAKNSNVASSEFNKKRLGHMMKSTATIGLIGGLALVGSPLIAGIAAVGIISKLDEASKLNKILVGAFGNKEKYNELMIKEQLKVLENNIKKQSVNLNITPNDYFKAAKEKIKDLFKSAVEKLKPNFSSAEEYKNKLTDDILNRGEELAKRINSIREKQQKILNFKLV